MVLENSTTPTGQLKAIVNYGYGHPGIGTEEYLIDKTRKEPNEIAYDKNR